MDQQIYDFINGVVKPLNEKLDKLIEKQDRFSETQAIQMTSIEVIKHDISGNGSPGIKQIIEKLDTRVTDLEDKPTKTKNMRIPWIIAGIMVVLNLSQLILKMLGVV